MNKLTAMIVLLMTSGAFAQSATEVNTSNAKQSEVAPQAAKKDIDEEITNAKLRAATGSKRNISFSSTFSYSGGALTTPLSTERPQLNDGQPYVDPAKLSGQMGIKARLTDHDNLSLGFGLDYTPSHTTNKLTGESEPARTNASTPYLNYSRVFRASDVQHVFDVTVAKYTAKEDIDDGKLNSELALSHTFMTSLGGTRFEAGMGSSFSQEIYSEYTTGTLYSLEFDPILEYAFTDKASFRTVYRAMTLRASNANKSSWKVSDTTESMGFGYALTRDIYLYPNMQWKWNAVAADKTTVGFSANINL